MHDWLARLLFGVFTYEAGSIRLLPRELLDSSSPKAPRIRRGDVAVVPARPENCCGP
jgi:hypothetical protein